MSLSTLKSKSAAAELDRQIKRGKAVLRELKATLKDLDDARELLAAKRRNRSRPGTRLCDLAKELGL